jgi:hypothetical protein
MIAAAFFIGAVFGAAAMILCGLYLVAKPKTQTRPQPSGIAAVGVSMNGNSGVSIDAFTAQRMNEIFRDFKNGTIQ